MAEADGEVGAAVVKVEGGALGGGEDADGEEGA